MTSRTNRPGRPLRPDKSALRSIFARAWYHCVASNLGVDPLDVAQVTRLCNEWLPAPYRRRTRDMAAYADGVNAPSVSRKGEPGIVSWIGQHLPRTLEFAMHPLWMALDADQRFDAAAADELLRQLEAPVIVPYVFMTEDPRSERDWSRLRAVREHYPRCAELAMDYVACYATLVRQYRQVGDPEHLDAALGSLLHALLGARRCRHLSCVAQDLESYIDRTVVPSGWITYPQHQDLPFYRGGSAALGHFRLRCVTVEVDLPERAELVPLVTEPAAWSWRRFGVSCPTATSEER